MNEQATRSSASVGFRTPLDCFTLFNGRRDTSFRKIIAEGGKFYPAGGKGEEDRRVARGSRVGRGAG
ncbi:hypothetical protein AERO9A_250177 [Aeromonas salmonicida]|nr:hypothetical protein AERO9A_250177 [Aeromonas salmonicida]